MDDPKKPKVTIADIASKNTDVAAQAEPGAAQPEETSAPVIKPEHLFYNVMPKPKTDSSMVKQVIKVETPKEETLPAGQTDSQSFFKKNRIYIVIAIVVIILGVAVYYIFSKIGAGNSQPVTLVTHLQNKVQSSSTTPSSDSTSTIFTTPQAWRDKYWPNCTDPNLCGDSADPDQDGLTNVQENKLGTDPNNADSDNDGLSDGDEVNVFTTDPLNAHSAGNPKYNDGDYFKGGYDVKTGKSLTPVQISTLQAKMRNFGLHEPTLNTLENVLNSLYNFSSPNNSSSSTTNSTLDPANANSTTTDQSLAAKQQRDAERSDTITKVEVALVKYFTDNKQYPIASDFETMYEQIKPYIIVATDPTDPLNTPPYVYSYSSNQTGTDFSLSFYSEVAGQAIAKNAAEATQDAKNQQASVYDNQRESDLQDIRSALLLYSQSNAAGNQTYVFPTVTKYKTALVPTYLETIPKDPKTGKDYSYQVSSTFDTFTLKAILDSPAPGTTGYQCNQDGCNNY